MNMTSDYSKLASGGIYERHKFVDATDNLADIIKQIKEYQDEGNYSMASAFATSRKDLLERCLINAETINAIEEEIRNIEILSLNRAQQIFYTNEAHHGGTLSPNDVWISRYKFQ